MLLNLSNHPIKYWEPSQIKAAKTSFVSIIDLTFPVVPPEVDSDIILELARKYFNKCINIIKKYSDEPNAVHVMGEMTFSFAIVSLLMKENILCLASTTDRNTSMIDDAKISKFKFVKFRKYSF